jgi:hypothetical protein
VSDRHERKVQNAYETGDLQKLVESMDDRQQLAFKMAVVRQTIYYVSQYLPPEDRDEGQRSFIHLAQNWLDCPTEEKARSAAICASFDCVDGGVRYFDYSDYFLEPAWAASHNAYDAISCALTAAKENAPSAKKWQLETALAILDDRIIPELETI